MERSVKHGLIIAAVGLFVLAKGSAWAWILLAIGFFKITGYLSHPHRTLYRDMDRDAKTHGCNIPSNPGLRRELLRVYAKYRNGVKNHPTMEASYTGIIDGMWVRLTACTELSEWRSTIARVMSQWPATKEQPDDQLEESLRRARLDAKHWKEARQEAYGEIH